MRSSAILGSGSFAALAFATSLTIAPRAARADAFQDRVDRAGQLAQAERFKEALVELEAAYGERQSPRLLYMIAKTLQRLGDANAALGSYERFLAADPDADAKLRGDAMRQVTELRRLLGKDVPAPRAQPAPFAPEVPDRSAPERFETRSSVGLIAGGATLFGAAYVAAIVTGSIVIEGGGDCSFGGCPNGNPATAGGTLLIPVLGPFIASFVYRDPVWSINWSLVDGVAQVGGLAMMIYGIKNPRKVPVYGRDFQILPLAGQGRTGLAAVGTF
jgi:hypothetical protein